MHKENFVMKRGMEMGKFFLSIMCSLACLQGAIADEAPFVAKDFSSLLQMQGWNQDLLKMHFTLYQGYVKNTNLLLEEMQDLNQSGKSKSYEFGALKRRFGWEFDGMRFHELYFDNLSQKPSKDIDKTLLAQIEKDFGSFDLWKQDFIATGLIRGIGWTILYKDCISDKLCNVWINEHDTGLMAIGKPLIVMDVFEHAYITQFGLDKSKYIDLFFQSLNWATVNHRWSSAGSDPFVHLKSNQNNHTKAN